MPELTCPACGLPCHPWVEDVGYGVTQQGGAWHNHTRIETLSDCCGAPLAPWQLELLAYACGDVREP